MPETADHAETFGRYAEVASDAMSPEMRDAYDYTKELRGLVPGPHKIWLANPRLAKTIVPTGAYFQTASTLSKGEIEIATSAINSVWRAAYANDEHETIGEQQGKLDAGKVQRIIAGLPTSFDDPREQIVYELAVTLAAQRVVPDGMFRRGQELLGDAGIVDVVVLMGWFSMVSLTLNVYDVPAGATGLNSEAGHVG